MIPFEEFLADARKHKKLKDRPHITISYAQSLDGCIALERKNPLKLSSKESRIFSHQLRNKHDAILVGIGTILTDDPQLNVRLVKGADPQPVILDSSLRLPLDAQLLKNKRKPWIFTTDRTDQGRKEKLEAKGAHILRTRLNEQKMVDIHYVTRELYNLGITNILVEGGARIITSFVQARLVDIFVIFMTPLMVGGLHAIGCPVLLDSKGKTDIQKFPKINIAGHEFCGKDIVIWGTFL